MADQSINLFQSGLLRNPEEMAFRSASSLKHHYRTEKFNSLSSPTCKQPVVPVSGTGVWPFLCQWLSKSIIVCMVGHLLGFKAGSKGREQDGGAICCCCCCCRCYCCCCCCLKSWLKHPLPGWLWERGHARVSPSADLADSHWHLGFGDTSASLCQPCHSLSCFCRRRCHPGSRTSRCLPSPARPGSAPAASRLQAEHGRREQPQPGRSRRRPRTAR